MSSRTMAWALTLVTTAACGSKAADATDQDDPPSVGDLYEPKAPPPKPTTRTGFAWRTDAASTVSLEPWHAVFASPNFPADRLTVGFTNILKLPRSIPVTGKECGKVSAYYKSTASNASITVCYELADFIYKAFRETKKSSKDALRETVYALMFIVLHEMGHAIIGELDLGVAGGEEQAADDFASVLLAEGAPTVSIDGARAMRALGKRSDTPKYFNEHPVGEQRFHNIYCVVYGSDPSKWASLVGNPLDEKRAAGCADEFRRKKKYWGEQLAPYGWRW